MAFHVQGAAGLVLPALTHIAPALVPVTATGLVLVMVGGAIVHRRRNEIPNIAVNVPLLVLATFVAWAGSAHTHSRCRRQTTLRPTRCAPAISVVKPAIRQNQALRLLSARINYFRSPGSLDQARDSAEPPAT